MGARGDGPADLGEVQGEGFGVGAGQHERGGGAARRADCAEYVCPLVALVTRRPRPGAAPGPDPGQGALLADPCLILEPDLDRLAAGVFGEGRGGRPGELTHRPPD